MKTKMLPPTTLFLNGDSSSGAVKEIRALVGKPNEYGLTDQHCVEQRIIKSVNEYNPNIFLKTIRYVPDTYFRVMKLCSSKFLGVIADANTECTPDEIDEATSRSDCWVEQASTGVVIHKVCVYVIVLPVSPGSRNIYVAQHLFPPLFYLIKEGLTAPGTALTDHPIYMLNMLNEEAHIQSTVRNYYGADAIGVGIVPTINQQNFPTKGKTADWFINYWGEASNLSIDNVEKKLKIRTDRLKRKIKPSQTHNGYYEFQGSEEKFYSLPVLGGSLMALREGYTLDVSEPDELFRQYNGIFSGIKLDEVETIIRYLQKVEKKNV